MRRNFVLFAVVPATILLVVLYFFLDGWVEAGLEYAGEKVVGAKVEIDNLSITLSPIGMSFQRLQVADPKDGWRNIVSTGRAKFALDFAQLLRAKYIIETMEVNDAVLGTRRASDGTLPPEPVETTADEDTSRGMAASLTSLAGPLLKKEDGSAPSFDLTKLRGELNIDSLTNPKNLLTYRHLDSLKRQIDAASTEWDSTLAAIDRTKAQVDEVEMRVRAISVNEIKTIAQATEAFNNAKAAYAATLEVTRTFTERTRTITDGINGLSSGIRKIDDVAAQDFRTAVALARLPDVSMKGIAELALGKDVMAQAYEYLGYVQMAREKIPSSGAKPGPEVPDRSRGITVHFPADRAYPKVWVQQILLSGGTDATQDPDYFYAKGRIADITNDQRITGKPITAAIIATKGNGTAASFDAFIDRRTDVSHDRYRVAITGVPVAAMSMGRSNFLPSKITNAVVKAQVEVDVPGGGFESNAHIDIERMHLQFERDPKNLVERIVRDVLSSIDGFFVDLRLWKNDRGRMDVAFATDLDNQLSARTKQAIGDEVARIQADIRAKVTDQIAAKRKEVESLFEKRRADVMKRVNDVENQVKQRIAAVEQKKNELEQRVEQEKKKVEDALKKKAGDTLKGVFKKK